MARLAAFLRLLLLLALAGSFTAGVPSQAREAYEGYGAHDRHDDGLGTVGAASLPVEARETLAAIRHGGPFPYPNKDAGVFGNFERLLPRQARGYYREYTVPTPGRRDRGARRIVAGSGRDWDVRRSGEYYYTDDHYRSFRRIREPSEP